MGPDRPSSPEPSPEEAAASVVVIAAEPIAVEETRIQEHASAVPPAVPAPASPATPTREVAAHVNPRAEREPEPESRRVPQVVVARPIRGSPDVGRTIDGNIDHLRIGRHDLDCSLVILDVLGYHLLGSRPQTSIRPCLRAHPLHRAHHIGLLSEERVPKVGRPADIVGQQVERIRKRDQRLDARVPILLAGGFHARRSLKLAVLAHPLMCLNDLQRIRAGGQHLAEQRVRVQRDRRDQVIQLVRRQKWRSLLCILGRRGLLDRWLRKGRRDQVHCQANREYGPRNRLHGST